MDVMVIFQTNACVSKHLYCLKPPFCVILMMMRQSAEPLDFDGAVSACEVQVIASLPVHITNTFNCVIALPFGAEL